MGTFVIAVAIRHIIELSCLILLLALKLFMAADRTIPTICQWECNRALILFVQKSSSSCYSTLAVYLTSRIITASCNMVFLMSSIRRNRTCSKSAKKYAAKLRESRQSAKFVYRLVLLASPTQHACWLQTWVAEPFTIWGGTSSRQTKYGQILWFELATVTSQTFKYGVITYAPHEGLNYIILDKITPPSKRIGEPLEIQIGCYRDDPGQQRHSDSSHSLFWLNKTVRGLSHWNFHLLSVCLALSLLCNVSYVTINEKFS